MTTEELQKREKEIVQRIRELQRKLIPTAQRMVTFGAIGGVAGGVWAWKTKQKIMVKIGAVFGGVICANLLSRLLISNEKTSEALELQQLQEELSNIKWKIQQAGYSHLLKK